jgi:hypothetical protein
MRICICVCVCIYIVVFAVVRAEASILKRCKAWSNQHVIHLLVRGAHQRFRLYAYSNSPKHAEHVRMHIKDVHQHTCLDMHA